MNVKKRQVHETLEKLMSIVPVLLCCIVIVYRTTFAQPFVRSGGKEVALLAGTGRAPFETYRQIARTEWKKLTNPTYPLGVLNCDLVANPSSSDKTMDKMIVGKVRNHSKRGFSEVKIEFSIYDEKGHEIAIVQRRFYDFRPQKIWTFEIPVTSDVEKATLNGLYVPSKEVK